MQPRIDSAGELNVFFMGTRGENCRRILHRIADVEIQLLQLDLSRLDL